MQERRHSTRYAVWFPMRVDAGGEGGAMAISRNVSDTGMLVATAARLEEGDPVTVTFRTRPGQPEQLAEGVIVRREDNVEDPDGLWPHRVAVEFKEPHAELEPMLRQLEQG